MPYVLMWRIASSRSVYHLDRQDQVEVLGLPVLFSSRNDVGQDLLRPGTSPQLHAFRPQGRGRRRQEDRSHLGMHQQGLHGVADAGALGFGVDHDLLRHDQICVLFHVGVAVADPGLQHRHRGVLHHRPDQPGAAPGDQHVDEFVHLQHDVDRFPVSGIHQLDRSRRQPGAGGRAADHLGDRLVGVEGLGAAPQDHGVPCLHSRGLRHPP